MDDVVERCATYEDILRLVCHHLEIPHSESGPCDDVRVYDRALAGADEYMKKADADLALNRKARFTAEAENTRLSGELAEARKAAKEIEKKAMWLRGDTAYREFPAFVTNRLRAAIRKEGERTDG